jgi:hypothetical protein
MLATNCLVRFKEAALPPLLITAAKVEAHGEHLAFLRSDGRSCGLFLREVVRDWCDIDTLVPTDTPGLLVAVHERQDKLCECNRIDHHKDAELADYLRGDLGVTTLTGSDSVRS